MVEIRKIKAEDAEQVKSLIAGIMGTEFAKDEPAFDLRDLENLPSSYGGKRDLFLVAEKEGKIVGTTAVKEDDADVALLRRIFVEKECRGKGYGTRLLNKALAFCFDHRYKTVNFRGTSRMQTALALCLKNGFEQADISELGDTQLVLLTKDI
jgi:GNAT superfamily N-acetyltransferase